MAETVDPVRDLDCKEKETVGCVSGYFDPIGIHHCRYINEAKKQCTKLLVIVNSDHQAILKKGAPFMPAAERMEILSNMRDVDDVVLSIDTDRTVCKTLELYKPDLFMNSGDVVSADTPEASICEKLDIKMVDLPGDKIQSSRWLIKKALSANFKPEWLGTRVDRQWGYYTHLLESETGYQVKKLVVYPGKATSYQKHEHRAEAWNFVSGSGEVYVGSELIKVESGQTVIVPQQEWHQLRNYHGTEDLVLIETQTGIYLGEDDITRIPSPRRLTE